MARAKKGDVSVFVRAAGLIAAVWTLLTDAVRKLGKEVGMTDEQVDERIHSLSTPAGAGIIEQWAAILVGRQPMTSVPAPTDWWDKFLGMMISACGFVSFRNSDVNGKNFPYQDGDLEPKQVETLSIKQKLRELGRQTMSTQEVKDYIDSMGYRSATLVELLWWWLKNPTEHTNCLVFALGSVWRGLVPCVDGYGGGRELYLSSTAHGWNERCSFAVVRK